MMPPSLAAARVYAARDIDEAAGRARLRYITDVPGQQAVYLMKLAEAEALLASPAGAVPPHLAAEAAATGQTAAAIAQQVIDLGALWNEQLSPAIEGARMGGKAAVSAAETLETVAAALAAALATLEGL